MREDFGEGKERKRRGSMEKGERGMEVSWQSQENVGGEKGGEKGQKG